jgi:ABC-type Zn uptake system ZnuABC Zn-binding protein ZnuA
MKRMLVWLIVALVALMLAIAPGAARKLRVVATTNDLKWAVEQIGGKNVEVVALMHPLQNPHTVQPRPSFIVQLNRADLLVRIGLDYEETWLPPLVEESRNPKFGGAVWAMLMPQSESRCLKSLKVASLASKAKSTSSATRTIGLTQRT